MKGGMAQGEALLKALSDSQIKWGTAPTTTAGDARRRQRSRSPNKSGKKRKVQQTLGKTQQNFQSQKGGKGEGGKGPKHANLAKGGKTICRAFNLGQCKDPCPYNGAHVCSIVGCGAKHLSIRHSYGC